MRAICVDADGGIEQREVDARPGAYDLRFASVPSRGTYSLEVALAGFDLEVREERYVRRQIRWGDPQAWGGRQVDVYVLDGRDDLLELVARGANLVSHVVHNFGFLGFWE